MSESNASKYFLSASRGTGSRSRLFRPKELREFVFPGVGMIMHSLFWTKHAAHLHQQEINPAAQQQLLLYAEPEDGDPLYDEGLLWYILASRIESDSAVQLTAGVKTVRNYLFEPQYEYDGDVYDRVAEEVQRMSTHGESYDTDRFVDEILASWFVTRCRDLGIDLTERLAQAALPAATDERTHSRTLAVLSNVCELLGSLVREHGELSGTSNLTVIDSTVQFATQLFIPDNESQLATLADPEFRFTLAETTALLRAVAAIEHGEHFLRSILFVTHIDPQNHSGAEFDREMRRIHDIVTSNPDSVLESGRGLVDLDALPPKITQNLDETSYHWLLNFFMADGETISRELLDTNEPIITRQTVNEYFEAGRDRTATFEDFLFRPDDGLKYLPRLLSELNHSNSPRVYAFLDQLQTNLRHGTDPPQVLLDLLNATGTLEPESEESDTYRIREHPANTNSASFYGIGPLRTWTNTLLQSHE